MSNISAFNLVLTVVLLTTATTATTANCEAQSWRDPALQQPLPQYYPANRYPLSDANQVQPTTPRQSIPTAATPSRSQPVANQMETLFPETTSNRSTSGASKSLLPSPDVRTGPSALNLKSNPRANVKTTAKQTPDKQAAKKADSKVAKKHPVLDYSIYRDPSRFPIDPRKPCSVCRRSVGKCNCGSDHRRCGLGNQGQPYQDREPGGYSCGKNCPNKRPQFSVYWPKPFSVRRAEGHPHRCNCDQCATRVNDRFDHLINFKLIDYQRTDNGYCGPGADPYGCLGESKYQQLGLGQVSH